MTSGMSTLVTRRGFVGGAAALSVATRPTGARAAVPDDVIAAAKREGKLVYWGPEEIPLVRAMAARFNQTYPGIEITHFRIEPGPAAQRMVAESQAGQVNVDAFDLPLLYMTPILDRGLAEKFDWHGGFGTDPDYLLYDSRAVTNWNLTVPICINTDLVQPGEITSWDDLLKPKWRGKVLLEARGIGPAILMEKWGEERTVDWIGRLKDNKPVILVGGSPAAEALSSGRVAVAIGTYASKIALMKEAGAPVDFLTVGPIPAMIYVNAVATGCAHPNAARLWAAWMASAAGSKAVWECARFGHMQGPFMSPIGEAYRKAGAEIVLEVTDPVVNQHRLTAAAAAIGAMK
jgi:iron(III) transport system substrate-binding protein